MNTSFPDKDAILNTSIVAIQIEKSPILNLFLISDLTIRNMQMSVGTIMKNASFGA